MNRIKDRFKASSMLNFLPKIEKLPIPQPETIVVPFEFPDIRILDDSKKIEKWMDETLPDVIKAIDELGGYPVFLRTDATSNKHEWKETCFVESQDKLPQNIFNLIEFHFMADILGITADAFLVREYIEMDTKFTAMRGDFPVGSERRYFVLNGNVLCHHPYWPKDAMYRPSIKDWREVLDKLNTETRKEVRKLSRYAKMVSEQFPSRYLSVDFCKAKDGKWYLIDMADGFESYHPMNCRSYKVSIFAVLMDCMSRTMERLAEQRETIAELKEKVSELEIELNLHLLEL